MFGIKKKNATKSYYPETFYLNFEYTTMAMDYETRKFLDQLNCGVAYKGRYTDSNGTKLELEAFKGTKLSSNFFNTEYCR